MNCFIIVISYAILNALALTTEQEEAVKRMTDQCAEETGVDRQVLLRAHLKNEFPEDVKLKKQFACMALRSKVVTEDGIIDMNQLKIFVREGMAVNDKVTADAIAIECGVQRETIEETAFHFSKCAHQRVYEYNARTGTMLHVM